MITGLGVIGGYLLGIYLGQLITVTYTQYFRFPLLLYTPEKGVIVIQHLAEKLGLDQKFLRLFLSLSPQF